MVPPAARPHVVDGAFTAAGPVALYKCPDIAITVNEVDACEGFAGRVVTGSQPGKPISAVAIVIQAAGRLVGAGRSGRRTLGPQRTPVDLARRCAAAAFR